MTEELENDFEVEVAAGAEAGAEADADVVEGALELEAEPEVAPEAEPAEPEFETPAIPTSFSTVTDRLSEIADVMEDESMPLDDALDLLEEAVALGMQASNLLETDMNERDAADEAAEAEAEAAEAAETLETTETAEATEVAQEF